MHIILMFCSFPACNFLYSILAPRDSGDTDEVRKAKGFIRDLFKVIDNVGEQ